MNNYLFGGPTVLRVGNVIQAPSGGKWIVTDVKDHGERPLISAVAFDAENCSATQPLDDHEIERMCDGCEGTRAVGFSVCETCKGRGQVKVHQRGWRYSTLLAPNVREFILNAVKKGFNL